MKKILAILFLVLFFPAQVRDARVDPDLKLSPPAPVSGQTPLQSLENYKDSISLRGQDLNDQGIVIETLDGRASLAEHNPDITFNPASVTKLATSLMAIIKLGPDYRYRTNFLADGEIDFSSRELKGDLVVEGGADPMFALADSQEVATELGRLGISRVKGSLRIAGPFYYYARGYHSNLSRETSASKLRAVLEQAGIKIAGETVFGEKSGTVLISHYSDELVRLLLYQNAFSSNAVAEVIGESLGGPRAVQTFLVERIGLRDSEIYVGRTSGLDFNRITPRASLKVLRALLKVLDSYSLKAEDVMPIAGIDSGTLRTRLSVEAIRGAVIAKTGTLVATDEGVSTLVGIAYTKSLGPLLFAVFNSSGSVNAYRRLQDQFLEDVIAEHGGAAPVSRKEDALAEQATGSIVQVLYKRQAQPAEKAAD